jgi:hypothetical protein
MDAVAVPRGVVGLSLIFDVYAPLSIATAVSVSLVGLSRAMEPLGKVAAFA